MQFLRTIGAAACIGAALFLLASLLSYHAYDSIGLYATLEQGALANWCGYAGAHMSAWLLFLFGSSAYLVVFALGMLAHFIGWRDSVRYGPERIIALLVFIPLLSMLFYTMHVEWYQSVRPGGVSGHLLTQGLQSVIDASLVPIIIFFALWSLLLVLVGFAWVVPCVGVLQRLCCRLQLDRAMHALSHHLIAWYAYSTAVITDYGKTIKNSLWDEEQEKQPVEDFESVVYDASFWGQHMMQQAQDALQELEKEAAQEAGFEVDTIQREYVKEIEEAQIPVAPAVYNKPDVTIFHQKRTDLTKADKQEQQSQAQILEEKLQRFGIKGSVLTITAGPVVTLFEYQPHIDVPISKILAREDDLALALQAMSLRIIAPIPGKSVIGFEVSNVKRKTVLFSESVNSPVFTDYDGQLPLIIGQNTIGEQVVIDLTKMPHLLVAGSTGSGKSVALNTMLLSVLCKATPDEVRLILIDPKRLEFAAYADIPHLVFPIVIDPHVAMNVLQWAITVMEQRYEEMAAAGVRNIYDYRALKRDPMPYIVIVIDELADLMMVAGKEIEGSIARLAQMARASGIHLVLATQRPSVDVITGVVKVNFPARLACKVTSKIDSRTILDTGGAEKLLGKGDMLFLDPQGKLNRMHGAYVTDQEIAHIVTHVKSQRPVIYEQLPENKKDCTLQGEDAVLYKELLDFVKTVDEVSISLLQRRFRIGYNRSARFIDILEAQGIIMPSSGGKTRKVLH